MAEDTRSTKDRFVEESIGMIKESLRVNRDTKGFGNIMKQTFSPANFFGADSKMGKMFSSTDERDRIRGYGGGKQKGSANTSQEVGVSPELKQIQADVADIKAIQTESKSDPEFRELDKGGKDQLSVSKQILATLRKQEPAMTKMQGDSVIALLKKGVGSGGGGGEESDSGPGFFSGALATGVMMKGKDLFAAGKNKAGSLMKGAKSAGGSLLRGAGGVARGLGGAGLGVGLGAYEAVSGAMGAERDLEGLEISAEEAQSRKGEAIGSGAGGAGGALAGAAAGAAVGSVVPVVGTLIGGIVGGAIGYFAGSAAGGAAGEAIADAIPVSEEDLKESNTLANEYLDKIADNPGGDELVAKIKSEATEIESMMMESTGKQPEELSENDIEAIANAALIKAIQNNREEAGTISNSGGGKKVEVELLDGSTVTVSTAEELEELENKKLVDLSESNIAYAEMFNESPNVRVHGKSNSGFEIPDEGLDRENFLIDYDIAKEDQQAAERNLAEFEAKHGERTKENVANIGIGGDFVGMEYDDPEVQAQFQALSKKNELAKRERKGMLAQEMDRVGGKTNEDKFRAIQERTGMSEDEVLAAIGGKRNEDGLSYSKGKLNALLQVETEKGLLRETDALYDRRQSNELSSIDESLEGELSDAEKGKNALHEMAARMGIDPSQGVKGQYTVPDGETPVVTSVNGKSTAEFLTPKEQQLLQEQAEINADIEAGYREGLSGNTNASVVENATDDANTATAPGATAPVVVQAPAPAPQPQPDINVVVSMPKTIGPETRSGVRMIGMLGNDY